MIHIRRHYKQLTEKEYGQIKQLMSVGVTNTQISPIVGRSYSCLVTIRRSKSFNDYHDITRRYIEKSKAKRGIKKETLELPRVPFISKSEEQPEKIITLLERIASSLEKMEEHWRYKREM